MEETAGPRSPQFSKHIATQSRACEQCHRRKIRCDRRLPCSNCQIADLECKASVRRSVMARIQPSTTSQADNRLGRIEEQLSTIQQTLTTLQNHVIDSVPSHPPPTSQAGITARTSSGNNENTLENQRERTGVKSQGALAYEDAIERSPLEGTALNIDGEVSSLDRALDRDDPRSVFHENPFPSRTTQKIAQAKIEWPPLNEIVLLLRWAKGPQPPTLLSFLPLVTVFDLTELCKKAYFAVEECSTSDLIIINSCLLFLLPEFSIAHSHDESTTENCHQHASLCQRNLETALADLNLFMALSLDNTKALVLASMYAIGISSLSMAWTLISTAARVCQSLGYHRLLSTKDTNIENVDTKKAIFGYVYILDKTLSLRLGRPSSMHEYDLAPDILLTTSATGSQSWDFVWCLWVEAATIHGWTFEQLYSPQAMNLPQQARLEAVQRLSAVVIAAKRKNSKLGEQFGRADDCRHQYLNFVKQANDVVYLSLLTLIYRSSPNNNSSISSPFSQECLEAARAALAAHHLCYTNYKDKHKYIWTIYLQWTVLACPFIPFLVIFCHAVTTLSLDTIKDLNLFVASLQPTSQIYTTSKGMHVLCQKFYHVGKSYIEDQLHKKQDKNTPDVRFRQDLTPGFSAFDLMPEPRQTSDVNVFSDACGLGNSLEQDLMADNGAWSFGDPHILGILGDGIFGMSDKLW